MTRTEAINALVEWLTIDEAILEKDDTSDYAEFIRRKDEAVRIALEALKDPLGAFIEEEVPFRLEEILEVPEERVTPEAVQACVDALNEDTDVMFSYDRLDEFLENTIAMYWGGKQND